MPVIYYSSSGAVSFAPVAARDQAVGPIVVALAPSPPDEIIEPPRGTNPPGSLRPQTALAIAALAAAAVLIFAGPVF